MTEQTAARPLRVAAVVVTYNRRDLVRRGVAAMLAQDRPVDEVVVVDNASGDGTDDMVRADFPSVHLIELAEDTAAAGGFAGSAGPAAPWRGYYQTRNQLAMSLERRTLPELWWWTVRNLKFCVAALSSGDQPLERVRLRALGAWHGLHGLSGRTVPDTTTAAT